MKPIITLVASALLAIGCSNSETPEIFLDDESVETPDTGFVVVPLADNPVSVFEPTDSDLVLNTAIYKQDGYEARNVIRVDVRTETTPGICTVDDQSGCTLDDVMADVVGNDELTVDIPVHFSSDDFADDGAVINAELRIRGGGSRNAPQKSLRIKLDSKEVLWRGERHLQLNKHPYESTRIRNKLAFDAMSEVPHLPSMRTQFVNLWIDNGEGPVDYGLFTHVEKPNDRHLEKHGLDPDANLYKAESFTFSKYNLEDIAIDDEGEPLDEDRFESSLEIEEGKDHSALHAMMTAFHDPDRSFDSVVDQYFNRNNVLTWMAVNILLNQSDATRHNFLLYNPSESERFYFLPWDYDAAMGVWQEPLNTLDNESLLQRLEYGYASGALNEFTSRYYQAPGAHENIIAAASFIRENYITDALMTENAALYTDLVQPYQLQLPDEEYNPEFNTSSGNLLAESPAKNEDALINRFSVPLPPTLQEPLLASDQWAFSWTPAFDLTGNELSYDLQVSTSIAFAADDIVVSITDIENTIDLVTQQVDVELLPAGDYFVRVTARAENEPDRYWQINSNSLLIDGIKYNGIMAFNVLGE